MLTAAPGIWVGRGRGGGAAARARPPLLHARGGGGEARRQVGAPRKFVLEIREISEINRIPVVRDQLGYRKGPSRDESIQFPV